MSSPLSSVRVHVGLARRALALSPLTHSLHRWRVLRRLGWEGIEDCFIAPDCTLIGTAIRIRPGAYLNYGVLVDALAAPVEIGREAHLGQRVVLVTGSHRIGGPHRRAGENVVAPIRIGDGAWIGAGAVVLPGVEVGEGAVIGAQALVTADVPPHTVYGGVPARALRSLPPGVAPA